MRTFIFHVFVTMHTLCLSGSIVHMVSFSHLKRRKLDAVLCADQINASDQVFHRLILFFVRLIVIGVVVVVQRNKARECISTKVDKKKASYMDLRGHSSHTFTLIPHAVRVHLRLFKRVAYQIHCRFSRSGVFTL